MTPCCSSNRRRPKHTMRRINPRQHPPQRRLGRFLPDLTLPAPLRRGQPLQVRHHRDRLRLQRRNRSTAPPQSRQPPPRCASFRLPKKSSQPLPPTPTPKLKSASRSKPRLRMVRQTIPSVLSRRTPRLLDLELRSGSEIAIAGMLEKHGIVCDRANDEFGMTN
jgi:hypothetical protein